jgi:hypothetical protein
MFIIKSSRMVNDGEVEDEGGPDNDPEKLEAQQTSAKAQS